MAKGGFVKCLECSKNDPKKIALCPRCMHNQKTIDKMQGILRLTEQGILEGVKRTGYLGETYDCTFGQTFVNTISDALRVLKTDSGFRDAGE